MDLEQFGPYRIEALLGRGGMGEVYRAFDTDHQRVVALKVLSEGLASDAGYRERFRREAHLAARLNEPHIVPIHRYGEIDGRLFLDMRLVPGRDVAAVLAEEGAMAPARAVSIVSQTARALDSAHGDGLVHRDVKPSNILVTGDADDEFVYLVDFGIARSTTDAAGPSLTQTGAALGSFDYMAPERFLEKPIDKRVDVYALACVLFESLTARRPFTGDGLATLMYAHLNTEAAAPSTLRPGLPRQLDAVVAKGLSKDPEQRYSSCGELAAAARAALRESGGAPVVIPAAPPTTVTPVRPQTVGFSDPGPRGYGPPSSPGTGGYGPPSSPGTGAYGPPPSPGTGGYGPSSSPGPGGYGPPSSPGPGGYGPPSSPGPGGYGPPAAAAAYGQASNPGPSGYPPSGSTYGPGGPAGPGGPTGGGGFGGASPSGGRRPNRLPWVLGAVALVAVLAVVLVIVLVGGGGDDDVADPTPTPTTTAPTTTPPTTTTAPPEDDPEETLRAILPGGFDEDDCDTGGPTVDGALAVLDCGPSLEQPGPTAGSFYLYEEENALDQVFLADMGRNGITPLPDGVLCPDAQGYGYYTIEEERAGRLACYIDDEQNAIIVWTQDNVGAEGLIGISGGGQEGLVTLMEWWTEQSNSDFVEN
ncbi:serine/threonine-protein kinase [Blastococcus sp. URHD0036]|uniref:serine/threonine-protein kinase n=1 Tax=Blastococcus sp. URHD0036 TaxID=1380356 RepID=UPI00068BB0F3|nr:serine/threonine-protein kinase [Blastococcus sp. URHD0036]